MDFKKLYTSNGDVLGWMSGTRLLLRTSHQTLVAYDLRGKRSTRLFSGIYQSVVMDPAGKRLLALSGFEEAGDSNIPPDFFLLNPANGSKTPVDTSGVCGDYGKPGFQSMRTLDFGKYRFLLQREAGALLISEDGSSAQLPAGGSGASPSPNRQRLVIGSLDAAGYLLDATLAVLHSLRLPWAVSVHLPKKSDPLC